MTMLMKILWKIIKTLRKCNYFKFYSLIKILVHLYKIFQEFLKKSHLKLKYFH